jgi:hypothetical protein
MLERLQNNRNALGLVFMVPAGVLLLLFLTYPLGLGVWLGFTDAKIGRAGVFVGLENYEFLFGDSVTRLALFNTLFYTFIASILKFVLGLWLAILMNQRLKHTTLLRAVVLLPWIVPTALSAIAFWWIFDSQFSIVSWILVKMGLIDDPDFFAWCEEHGSRLVRDKSDRANLAVAVAHCGVGSGCGVHGGGRVQNLRPVAGLRTPLRTQPDFLLAEPDLVFQATLRILQVGALGLDHRHQGFQVLNRDRKAVKLFPPLAHLDRRNRVTVFDVAASPYLGIVRQHILHG